MNRRRLVADVGGSNVRLAIADQSAGLTHIKSYRVADFSCFAAALDAYAENFGRQLDVEDCAVAAAGPLDGDRVTVTNNDWSIDRAEIAAKLNDRPVVLVNDLEAVATALPHLALDDLVSIGGPAVTRPEHRTMLALNVGTGFGAASAMFRGGRWWTVPSEAGHMTLGRTATDDATMPADATVESVLSGRGVAALYRRLAGPPAKTAASLRDAGDVFARVGRDDDAARTLASITRVLGRVAGNLALATAAWGGVYFCGSVATAWAALADATQFRAEFIGRGPMRGRLERVPTSVIRRDNVALFGLAMLPNPA